MESTNPTSQELGEGSGTGSAGLQLQRAVYINEPSTYVHQRLMLAFQKRKDWRIVESAADEALDVQWDVYENVDWDRVLKGRLMANFYCFRKGLTRKAQLAFYLKKYCSKRPSSPLVPCVPKTVILDINPEQVDWCLVDAREAFEEEKERTGKTGLWILKPSLGDKAAGIIILNNLKKLKETVMKDKDLVEWVLQKYVEKPLLVNKKKFHLRVHVLAVGRLKVYVHEDVIALIAMDDYIIPEKPKETDAPVAEPTESVQEEEPKEGGSGLSKKAQKNARKRANRKKNQRERRKADEEDMPELSLYGHITNSCLQRDHPGFDEDATVRLLSELVKELGEEAVKTIWERVKVNVKETFAAFRGEFSAFMPLPNCFELFGFDFLVDENLNPIILEVNCGPDMKNTGSRLDHAVVSFLDDTLAAAVDPYFDPELAKQREATEKEMESQIGRLHLVYADATSFPAWGMPNMSFKDY